MEETDIIMCQKKRNKDWKNVKEITVWLKNKIIFFICIFFFFSIYKIGSTVLSYDETCIIKNAFHKTATSINIVGVGINKTL